MCGRILEAVSAGKGSTRPYSKRTNIGVFAWGKKVGLLEMADNSPFCSFSYADEWKQKGLELSPLKMETAGSGPRVFRNLNLRTYHGLPGLFADSLPDGYGEKAFKAMNLGLNGPNVLDKLAIIGTNGIGALEYRSSDAGDHELERADTVELVELLEASRRLAICKPADWQASLFFDPILSFGKYLRLGTSAGGAKPKALIGFDERMDRFVLGASKLPSGFKAGILKFSGFEDNELIQKDEAGLVEYAYHLIAKAAGISMAPSHLIQVNGKSQFLTERFDRNENGKVHYQSLCALAHFDLRARGMYDYLDLVQVADAIGLSEVEKLDLFKRSVFNVVMRNQDDHTKNSGFLMDQDSKWRLAPAFDMTFSFNPNGRWTKVHRMGVMGCFFSATRKDLALLGRHFDVSDPEHAIDEVLEAGSQWASICKDVGLSKASTESIGGLLRLNLRKGYSSS